MSELLKRQKPQLLQFLENVIKSKGLKELEPHQRELGNIVKNALSLVKELNASRSLQDILVNIVQSLLLPVLRMKLSEILMVVPRFLSEVCGG
jgi:hypothetical protein